MRNKPLGSSMFSQLWSTFLILLLGGTNCIRANEQILRSFGTNNADGQSPQGTLLQTSDGTLYGTTLTGGTRGFGAVFQIGPDGTDYKILHSFVGSTGGANPIAGVVLGTDQALYGLTSAGGGAGAGTAYRIDVDGGNYRVLHHFGTTPTDGLAPSHVLLLGLDGAFYGATVGGGTNNYGTVFRLDGSGTNYQLLHVFNGGVTDGANPDGSLVQDAHATLYGTTIGGGAYGGGTIFSLKPDGTAFSILHSFGSGSADGFYPQSLLMGKDGYLYGISPTSAQSFFKPTLVFRIKPDGTGFAVIKSFLHLTLSYSPELSQGADGTLFGTSPTSSTNGLGFAFRLNTDGTGFEVLHFFGSTADDGRAPYGGLLPGIDGALYGTTSSGGTSGQGTVFRLTTKPVNTAPFKLSITSTPPSGFHISAEGILGSTYYFQTSTDLFNWYPIGVVSNETGLVEFFDWNKTTNSQRFYRMLQAPSDFP